jgi:sensor histidine kinase YesM
MTFVENAFKFGISNHEPSTILIRILATGDKTSFICQNKVFNGERNRERTGIGLTNTAQRLDYLYKNKYDLQTGIIDGVYTVKLHINNSNQNKS